MKSTFSVLTYNVALMRVIVYEPILHVSKRLAALPNALRNVNADMVCFQELWHIEHLEFLKEKLGDVYPYIFTIVDETDSAYIPGGLAIFSKHEIVAPSGFENIEQSIEFNANIAFHEYFARKGALAAHVFTPLGYTAIVNTHLVAYLVGFSPNGKWIRRARAEQISDIVKFVRRIPGDVRLVFGDFNSGPNLSRDNYEFMLSHGFDDAWTCTRQDATASCHTYDTKNMFNIKDDRHGASDRIDLAFIEKRNRDMVRVNECRVVLDDIIVDLGKGKSCPLSDHYGLLTVFSRV